MSDGRTPGVYLSIAPGDLRLVHAYLDEHYELADIADSFKLGEMRGETRLAIDARTLRTLKVMADAESFDHAPEFISMCLDIAALEIDPDVPEIELVSIG